MLFVLNLDWVRFGISEQVVEANRYMEELAANLQVDTKVIFNCASIHAGEHLLPFGEGALGKNDMPKDDTLDYLRWHHQKVREAMWGDIRFRANRDVTEMLDRLKNQGHQLVAIWESSTQALDKTLRQSRVRHYFDENIYGYAPNSSGFLSNKKLSSLFDSVVKSKNMDYDETLIVADSPEVIQDATFLPTGAIVGYLDPYVSSKEQDIRLREMRGAGAHFTVVGGHYVTALPTYLSGPSTPSAQDRYNIFEKLEQTLQ